MGMTGSWTLLSAYGVLWASLWVSSLALGGPISGFRTDRQSPVECFNEIGPVPSSGDIMADRAVTAFALVGRADPI